MRSELQNIIDEHSRAGDAMTALWRATYGIGKTPDAKEAVEFKYLQDEYARLDTEIHDLANRLGVKLETSSVVQRPAHRPSKTRH